MKRFYAVILSLILLLLLSSCCQNDPSHTEPTTPTDPTEAPTLSQADLKEIEDYLNNIENNGFISYNYYTSIEEIDLLQVFYNGAGMDIPLSRWDDGEADAVLAVIGWEEFFNSPIKIPAAAANTYLTEKCGKPLSSFNNGTIPGFHYVESYDAYYTMHGDTNRTSVTVVSGQIDENGQYIVHYTFSDGCPTGDEYIVTMRKTDKGYQFISNIDVADDYDPYAIHDISSDLITIDGNKKTYINTNFSLSIPADWLALERHMEDSTDYYFRDSSLQNCQLSISQTGAAYAFTRTEAEYQSLFSHWGYEDVEILSYTKEKLSDFDCIKVVYSYTDGGTAYTAVRYDNIIRGFTLFEFIIVYPAAESDQYAPVFESIIDSIALYSY